jgi:hypothetical protein
MKNGESPEDRLKKRIWILSNIESIIKESVYYRSNSGYMDSNNRLELICIEKESSRVNINEYIS